MVPSRTSGVTIHKSITPTRPVLCLLSPHLYLPVSLLCPVIVSGLRCEILRQDGEDKREISPEVVRRANAKFLLIGCH